MLTLACTAFLLGLLFNAAPGALFAETVRRGMAGGFRPALAVQTGSLAGDALWAVLGLAGAGLLLQHEALRWPLGLAGVAYLVWLSLDSWRAARRDMVITHTALASSGTVFRSGVVLSVTNPQNLAYWAALGSAMTALGVSDPQPGDYAAFFTGFMVSSVLWCFVCASLVARLFGGTSQRRARVTHRLCAIALLALASALVRDLLHSAPASQGLTTPATSIQGMPWQR